MKDIPEHIFTRAAGGDKDAFRELYTITSGFVYGTALRVTRNTQDAEEVTQDVFMKVHRKLKRFEVGTSFKAWIYRITFNTSLNTCKKRQRETVKIEGVKHEVDVPTEPPVGTAGLDRIYYRKKLDDLLALINVDQRACILLREIEGLDYKEIARVLKININTVRTRLKRARERLMHHARKEVSSYEM